MCTLYFYRYAVNPLAIRLVSLPQGAANNDFDNESGDSAVGSEPEDIGDTPTSVRRVCSY